MHMQTLNESPNTQVIENKVMTYGSMMKRWADRRKDGQTGGRMDVHMVGLCKNIMTHPLSVEEYEHMSSFCNAKFVNFFQQQKKNHCILLCDY